jgi:DNA-directed RNA polymerase specialized sigma24 family protein
LIWAIFFGDQCSDRTPLAGPRASARSHRTASHLDRYLPAARESAQAWPAAWGPHAAGQTPQATNIPDATAATAGHELEHELQLAERHTALREALAHLPPGCQRLLTLLLGDPPVPDAKISAEVGIPIGRIGPDRGRCLAMLRAHPAIAALINAGHANAEPAPPGRSSPAMTHHRQPPLPPA